MWIKDNQLYSTHSDIRQACPNISFPASLTDEMIADAGFTQVIDALQTAYDPMVFRAEQEGPRLVDGVWTRRWAYYPLTPEEIAAKQAEAFTQAVTAFDTALTAHLDNTAKAKRYDNRITCMVRAGFPGPFHAEGTAFAAWCDTCNILAYQMLQAVQAGTQPMPESPQAFIATLPAMVWP